MRGTYTRYTRHGYIDLVRGHVSSVRVAEIPSRVRRGELIVFDSWRETCSRGLASVFQMVVKPTRGQKTNHRFVVCRGSRGQTWHLVRIQAIRFVYIVVYIPNWF